MKVQVTTCWSCWFVHCMIFKFRKQQRCERPLITNGNLPPHPAAGITVDWWRKPNGLHMCSKFEPPEINKCQVFILLLTSINIYMKSESRRQLHLQRLRNEDLAWTGFHDCLASSGWRLAQPNQSHWDKTPRVNRRGLVNCNTLSHH